MMKKCSCTKLLLIIVKLNILRLHQRKQMAKLKKLKIKQTCCLVQRRYEFKNQDTLKKHLTTKHSEHQCKDCQEKLPTFMHLLIHITQHHYKNQSETEEGQDKEHQEADAIQNYEDKNLKQKRSLVLFFMSQCWMNSCKEKKNVMGKERHEGKSGRSLFQICLNAC